MLREAAEAGAVPGVVAMAATRDGPVYQGAFGKRVLPSGAAMTVDTLFWIASMTKAITSTAAMQLVERGKLALDRLIRDVLPQLAAAKVLEGFDSAGEPKLRPAGRDITLRHLLTHTAGFAYDIWSPDLIRYQEKKGIPGVISCQNVALTTPLLFDPGERWNYGINIDWVGKAVEKVSGQKLDAYFRDNIFGPLGMRDTGFKLDASRRARLSGMHARQPDGSLQEMPFELPQEPEFHMGGGRPVRHGGRLSQVRAGFSARGPLHRWPRTTSAISMCAGSRPPCRPIPTTRNFFPAWSRNGAWGS